MSILETGEQETCLGKGQKLEDVLENMGMVVEGVRTTKAAYQLAKKYDVNMPITKRFIEVLFNGQDAKEAVDQLMSRMKTNEMEELFNILDNRQQN